MIEITQTADIIQIVPYRLPVETEKYDDHVRNHGGRFVPRVMEYVVAICNKNASHSKVKYVLVQNFHLRRSGRGGEGREEPPRGPCFVPKILLWRLIGTYDDYN